ncbi:MAG: hypothetical protein CL583_06245 [Alteromonadaceae bacterium]|nr:hypothetical protein [Alteromonadaceae bacterium]|tara:strand:+ start:789 stop:1298 length:510 start_codon:yes stop_codon:yes gene_type:complete
MAIVGVLLGFMLGEGARWIRYRYSIRVAKAALAAEIRADFAQLPKKLDIFQQSVSAMKKGQVLRMQSVHFAVSGYNRAISGFYPHFTTKERTCLHVIYENFRIVDEFMDEFEDRIVAATKDEAIRDPWTIYINKCNDLMASLEVQKHLAQSYLEGKPEDVFGTEAEANQ